MKRLTNKQAISILPAVVDNEATDDEKAAFFEFISHNQNVRDQYNDALLVKRLVQQKYKKTHAPSRLKKSISEDLFVEKSFTEDDYLHLDKKNYSSVEYSQTKEEITNFSLVSKATRYVTAAAVILLLSIVTVQLLDRTAPHSTNSNTFIVEQMAAQHFLEISDEYSELHLQEFTATEAEAFLNEQHEMQISIPELKGAQFDGIIMTNFIEGFETPLLGYTQPDINETIFIFAFNVDQIDTHKQLSRDKKAVESCEFEHDFHVAKIADRHVVSWLWGNSWYTAISNHNGYDLAALVEPLEYTP